jgi:hypothetical protein
MRIYALMTAVGLSIAGLAAAAEPCKTPPACTQVRTCGAPDSCARCGACCSCEKRCCIVCTYKEVKKTVWVVKCEEFCPLLPQCGRRCGCGECGSCSACGTEKACAEPNCGCDDCSKKCDPCAAENDKCYVTPKCGKMRERKILEKKEIVCMAPVYKCIVVYCCPSCGCNESGGQPSAAPPAGKSPAPTPAPAPVKSAQSTPTPATSASFME